MGSTVGVGQVTCTASEGLGCGPMCRLYLTLQQHGKEAL
jgi:hypothetical protein